MAQESPRLECQHGDATPIGKATADRQQFSPRPDPLPPPELTEVKKKKKKSGVATPEEQFLPPSTVGGEVASASSSTNGERRNDDQPDFPEDPPAEGHVNVPVRSRNQPAVTPVTSSFVASDQVLHDLDSIQLDKTQGDSMSESSIAAQPPPPVLDIPLGMEGVMDEIVGLIDQMPLEDEQEVPHSEYFFPAARMTPAASVEYNPLARPTSRWKCRWKTFAPPEEPTYSAMPVPGFVPRSSPRGQRDFKNPYIKALNHTREELDKSWSLFITEDSIATRMATEREGALSSMQVFEVDYAGDRDVLSRLSCMPPEPCGNSCRNSERLVDYPVELCEIQQCEHHFDYKCQGVMAIESDMHRAGESNEVIMAPLSELRRKREDV